jgi:hypothetical protein
VHTFSPERDRHAQALAGVGLVLAACLAVVVFFPAEGRLLLPMHQALEALLGQATFLLPLGLGLAGVVGLVRRAQPNVVLPIRRLGGLAVIALALLPGERLLGESTGILGNWLTGLLLELLGGPLSVALILIVLGIGVVLTFGVKFKELPRLAAR